MSGAEAASAVPTRFGRTTLAALLDAPSGGGVTLVEGGGVERRVPHDELAGRARARLARWRAAGAVRGDRVVLLLEERGAFLECLHAAWLGALVPVPVAGGTSDEHRAKLFAIARTLGEPWLATDAATLERLEAFAAGHALGEGFAALARRLLPSGDAGPGSAPARAPDAAAGGGAPGPVDATDAVSPDDVALIQFSSGSTGAPKGVVLTHANLLANVDAILTGMAMTDDDVMLSWMPLTHDMGLIGFHLVPRLAGIEHVLMPTELFVRRPGLWLERASAHRASVLCSPNFGYEHALKGHRPERAGALELSAVRLVFNGAEPISAALAERFCDVFAASGLARTAMFPVYGLAEASLAVSFPPVGAPLAVRRVRRDSLGIGQPMRDADDAEEGVALVGVGAPIPHVEVRIADRAGATLAPGHVGRILIRGPNVTAGYLAGDGALDTASIDADGWLDTGDLGAVAPAPGEPGATGDGTVGATGAGPLFVTGRTKDIVFAGGRNLYPADLERTVVEAGAAAAGRVVVAAVPTADAGADLLAAFVQHRAGPEAFAEVADAVRAALAGAAGVRCDLVVPIQRVPKTTSGKVQRFRLVEALLAGELGGVEELERALAHAGRVDEGAEGAEAGAGPVDAGTAAAPVGREAIRERLLRVCRARVEGGAVALDDNLFELGISSLTLAAIHADIEATWPGALDVTDLFDHPSVAEIAEVLHAREG